MSGFWRRLRCRVLVHETPEPWEAPRSSYTRTRVLGRQDGLTFYRTQYRCKYCGAWFEYRWDVTTSLWSPPTERAEEHSA